MIDSHCHLDFSEFDGDREQVINRSLALGITDILIPGTQVAAFQKQLSIAAQYKHIHVALGLHPYFLKQESYRELYILEQALSDNSSTVVAVGEIGLDFSTNVSQKLQIDIFSSQLKLAAEYHLPIVVHHRQSHNKIIQLLKANHFRYGGVIHAFSGSLVEAETYIEMGFKLGVGGVITYERAKKTRNVFSHLSLTSLVLETDAPDMPMIGKQGERNSPEFLPVILDALASLRIEEKDEIEQVTDENYRMMFSLPNAKGNG